MDKMRISLTVLPVGPRSSAVLDASENLWFAVQATAGYEDEVDNKDEKLKALWPWNLLPLTEQKGVIALRAWLVKRPTTTKKIHSSITEYPLEDLEKDEFTQGLRKKIANAYKEPAADLDLRLRLPGELGKLKQDGQEAALEVNFPARVSYLSSLPGEISRRLIATIYFTVKRDMLYQKVTGEWKPKDDYQGLWVVPKEIKRGNDNYKIKGNPVWDEKIGLWTQSYWDTNTGVAYGPAYQLDRYYKPHDGNKEDVLFDLSTLWQSVSEGDSRYEDLGRTAVKVFDPLSEASRIPLNKLRSKVRIVEKSGQDQDYVLAEEELLAAMRLWRVQALADLLAWNPIERLETEAKWRDKLNKQIKDKKIEFDVAKLEQLENVLLRRNSGTRVVPQLQELICKLSELARVRIGSLVRSDDMHHHDDGWACDITNIEDARALLSSFATDVKVEKFGIGDIIFDAGVAGEADRNKWNYYKGEKYSFDDGTLNQYKEHIHISVTLPRGLIARALKRLVLHLPKNETDATLQKLGEIIVDELPGEWKEDLQGSLLDTVRVIQQRLSINEPDERQALRSVAERADFDTVCLWLEQRFSASLRHVDISDKSEEIKHAWNKLRQAWDLAEVGSKARAERRRSLAHLAVEQELETQWLEKTGEFLRGAASNDDIYDTLKVAIATVIDERWKEKRTAPRVLRALKELSYLDGVELDSTRPVKQFVLEPDSAVMKEILDKFIDTVFPKKTQSRRKSAAQPIELVFGPPKHRLVHEDNAKEPAVGPVLNNDLSGVFNEVTGHSLLARRAKTYEKLEEAQWRMVSGGVAVLAEPQPKPELVVLDEGAPNWLRELLPIAEENVFVDGIMRADRGYDGQLRHIQSPLDVAYAAAGAVAHDISDETDKFEPTYTYHGLGSYSNGEKSPPPDIAKMIEIGRAPVFRYGDWYQFAAPIIDAASGLPADIARVDAPWRLDLGKILKLKRHIPPKKDLGKSDGHGVIWSRRGEPVGEVNILPDPPDYHKSRWPKVEQGVALRVLEWQRAQRPSSELTNDTVDNIPVVLLYEGDADRREFTCYLEPPAITEFTLRRWEAPPHLEKSDSHKDKHDEQKEKILNTLIGFYVERQKRKDEPMKVEDFEKNLVTHDGAVIAIGYRVQAFDRTGSRIVNTFGTKELEYVDDDVLRRKRIAVKLSVNDSDPTKEEEIQEKLKENALALPLSLPDGWFACIDLWPLVDATVFKERFDEKSTFSGLLETNSDITEEFDGYVAFQSSRLLVETATSILPSKEELFERLELERDGDAVLVKWRGPRDAENDEALQFVDCFMLDRERWQWRNRPVLSGNLPKNDQAERRRLAASGLPRNVYAPNKRDSEADVKEWEKLAGLDRGFVKRGVHSGRWPRYAPRTKDGAGGVASDVTLLVDRRDGSTAGDFLRYELSVISRYEPLLMQDEKKDQRLRRIVMPYAGSKKEIKPPKIMHVLPLTSSIEQDPFNEVGSGGPTPFVVILDECWFREFGVGEMLRSRLVLENRDLGESEDKKRPYRTGGLPDHHHWTDANPPSYYGGHEKTDSENDEDPILLDAFGPFGMTLDRTSDEALANSSMFVVYPPSDVGSHWAIFVEFQRELAFLHPDETASDRLRFESYLSKPSGTYPIYTLPDARELATSTRGSGGALNISRDGTDYTVEFSDGLRWSLNPLTTTTSKEQETLGERGEEAKENYRYFLVVSRMVFVAGQTELIERPVRLLRIDESSTLSGEYTLQSLRNAELLPPNIDNDNNEISNFTYRGRILEILVNGKYPFGQSRLDRKKSTPSDSERVEASEDRDGEITERDFWDLILSVPVPANEQESVDRQDAAGAIRRISRSFEVNVIASDRLA